MELIARVIGKESTYTTAGEYIEKLTFNINDSTPIHYTLPTGYSSGLEIGDCTLCYLGVNHTMLWDTAEDKEHYLNMYSQETKLQPPTQPSNLYATKFNFVSKAAFNYRVYIYYQVLYIIVIIALTMTGLIAQDGLYNPSLYCIVLLLMICGLVGFHVGAKKVFKKNYAAEQDIVSTGTLRLAEVLEILPGYHGSYSCMVILNVDGRSVSIRLSRYNTDRIKPGDKVRVMDKGGESVVPEGNYAIGKFDVFDRGASHGSGL